MEDNTKGVRISDLPRLWVRKILTVIFVWDGDKDGQLGLQDSLTVADNIVKIGNLSGKEADKLYEFWKRAIDGHEEAAGNEKWYSKPMEEQVLGLWTMANGAEKKPWVTFWENLFKALDFNSDGFISFEEFLIFWKALKLDPSLARLQFDYLDTNHDGEIAEKELVDAFDDFLFNTDVNDNGNRFFGPLLDF